MSNCCRDISQQSTGNQRGQTTSSIYWKEQRTHLKPGIHLTCSRLRHFMQAVIIKFTNKFSQQKEKVAVHAAARSATASRKIGAWQLCNYDINSKRKLTHTVEPLLWIETFLKLSWIRNAWGECECVGSAGFPPPKEPILQENYCVNVQDNSYVYVPTEQTYNIFPSTNYREGANRRLTQGNGPSLYFEKHISAQNTH